MQLRSEFTLGKFHIRVNWLIAVCVLMTMAAFARLGIWQLNRAAEQVAAFEAVQAELSDTAPPVEEIPAGHLHRANPELQNRHVTLRGEYLNDREILLAGEFFDGQIGYGVVTPLRLASNGELVLVSRGWTTGILPPDTDPVTRPVAGPVTVTAQIYVPPENARIIPSQVDASSWPVILRSLELDVISQLLGAPVFPFELRLTEDQAGTLIRHWPAVNVDVNQNLSYALQWFTFALIVLLIALLASSNLWSLIKGNDQPGGS